MTPKQYGLLAQRYLRSEPVKRAAHAVIFDGISANQAEINHQAPAGTVSRAVKAIRREWAFIETLLESNHD